MSGGVKRNLSWYSTADDVVKELNARADGKVVIVTGANTGIGIETARTFASIGANVILACRNIEKGNQAMEDIKRTTHSEKVEVQQLDLTSLKSVREFAEKFIKSGRPLHYLLLNAGIMACPYSTTEDGFEIQLGTNHLAHFLLANLLLEPLKAGSPSRVISVSSSGHKLLIIISVSHPEKGGGIHLQNFEHYGSDGSYWRWWAYGRSKLANVMFANEFAKRYQQYGITAHSLDPGNIKTELGRYTTGFSIFYALGTNSIFPFLKVPTQGAATTVYAALAPEHSEGGKYFSNCQAIPPSSYALDPEANKQLWERSAKVVGLE